MVKENIILVKSFDFALHIIKTYKTLKNNNEYILSKQLLRSGTSIGANVNEASAAQKKKDFIAKNVNSIKRSERNKILARAFKSI